MTFYQVFFAPACSYQLLLKGSESRKSASTGEFALIVQWQASSELLLLSRFRYGDIIFVPHTQW